MPARIDPRDWDRLFRPNAPRRGGPLRALGNMLFVGVVLAVFAVGFTFALRAASIYQERQAAQSTAQAEVEATNAARVESTQAARIAAATATAETGVPQEAIGVSSVIVPGGNLRSEPVVADNTVIGQICRGDQVVLLEEQTTDTGLWYRIRVTGLGEDCEASQRLGVDAQGWVSNTLLGPPAPPQ